MPRATKQTVAAALRRAAHMAIVIVLIAVGGMACVSHAGDENPDESEMPQRSIEEVLSDYTPTWMSMPGVVGTGIGKCDDQPCIRVMVAKKTPELLDKIPSKVEGYVVDVIETGHFRPRPPR